MTTILSGAPSISKQANVTELLREQIISGDLQPGDRLPSFSEMHTLYGIAPSTIDKVLNVLENEGLVQRLHGKGVFVNPRKVPLKCIGFLSSESGTVGWGLYWAHIVEGLQAGAHAAGYDVMLLSPDSYAASYEKVDGVILHELQREVQRKLQLPTARVWVMSQTAGVASVVPDDFGGAYQSVEHLLALGHRRIAYLSGNAPWSMTMRLMGYRKAFWDAGLEQSEDWVRAYNGLEQGELGRNLMREWLDSDWKELGCTALLCNNDDVALGVMELLSERGIRVPEDLSVMGFDGTILCQTAHPRLTSIAVPLREIGIRAVELLLEQIESGKSGTASLSLPTTLMLGGSTSRPTNSQFS
jgi:DNA-binding LacI/PurR family transcriptional regulator